MAISPLFAISILRNGGDDVDVEDDDGGEKDRVCNEEQLGLMKLSDCKDDANFDLMGELAADVGVVLLTLLKHLLSVQLLDPGDVE